MTESPPQNSRESHDAANPYGPWVKGMTWKQLRWQQLVTEGVPKDAAYRQVDREWKERQSV